MTKKSFYERIENILESKSLTYEDLFFMINSIVDGLEAVGSLDLVRPEKEIKKEDDKEDEVKVYQNNIAGIPLEVVYGALFDEN